MKTVWLMNHYAAIMFFDKAGRHYWFAKQLLKRGYNVRVFCSTTFLNKSDVIDTNGQLYKTQIDENVPFVFVKTLAEQGNGFKRLFSWISFARNLVKAAKNVAKKEGKPDVIIASSVHPLTLVAGLKVAKILNIPCICEIRDLWPEALFTLETVKKESIMGYILSKGEHWIYKKANALIFTKEGDIDHLIEERWTINQGGDISPSKCFYINNGVDIVEYNLRIDDNQLDDDDLLNQSSFTVTYTGTLRPTNNVGKILDAAKIIASKRGYESIQFLIYGNGLEFESLQKRIENEHIINVKMKGFVERKYIPFILSKSSINLLNYSQEKYNWTRGNSSNKLFEYMASGKPIISTVQMGYSIIKRYNCGVELDKDTPEALAEQILRFHDMSIEEREKMGKNAKKGASDFDFGVLTKKLINVIESVF